jgi:hypothetical protein
VIPEGDNFELANRLQENEMQRFFEKRFYFVFPFLLLISSLSCVDLAPAQSWFFEWRIYELNTNMPVGDTTIKYSFSIDKNASADHFFQSNVDKSGYVFVDCITDSY